ncbi:MAG TPA: SidA/IucD/PvdA family monooxygenase [Pilimelia sp.]|nr:SidA/IucD/PvdA family monooxygenase [Pilimelia sp.]
METYDLIGLGFGPSNLSVAIALEESGGEARALFLDRKPGFAWHPGLLFDTAEMQVSFLKDLVSMRNPRSRYSFLNYLAERGRLAKFINLRTFYPTRAEFNDYYAWVAEQFAHSVRYATEIVGVEPVSGASGTVEQLTVRLRDLDTGQESAVRTANLVLAAGGQPFVPPGVAPGQRVFHAQDALPSLAASFADPSAPYHFNIVGAGQTAADVFLHLRRTYPNGRITTSIRGFAMRPEDDTHFVNELFLPEMPDWFYAQDHGFRSDVLDTYGLAAHTGVSYDLIPRLYREHYEDLVSGRDALRIQRFVELVGAAESATGAVARYRALDTGEEVTVDCDAVVLATGYRYPMPIPALAGVQRHLHMAAPDRYAIERDYAIRTDPDFQPRIFLQGYAEATHGFSEVLLSLMPFRAAEIVASAVRPAGVAPAGPGDRIPRPRTPVHRVPRGAGGPGPAG